MALLANAADKDDLTGANEPTFKAHLGQVISLRGRLEMGKEGMCLWDGPGTNVSFYVIPEMPKSGSYIYPEAWEKLTGHQVRITGELKFASFPHPPENTVSKTPPEQAPPDYYYTVLQRTRIEALSQ